MDSKDFDGEYIGQTRILRVFVNGNPTGEKSFQQWDGYEWRYLTEFALEFNSSPDGSFSEGVVTQKITDD